MTNTVSLTAAHKRSRLHRAAILASNACACFYCLAHFTPAEITEWIEDGETALCPKCGIDSVLYTAPDMPLTDMFLQRMQQHYF
ncbi:MAG: cytoplasmic protein [Armatimonas sp.]